MMLVKELCQRLMDWAGPDAVVAIEDADGTIRHVSRTSPQKMAEGTIAVLSASPRLVTEEDLA